MFVMRTAYRRGAAVTAASVTENLRFSSSMVMKTKMDTGLNDLPLTTKDSCPTLLDKVGVENLPFDLPSDSILSKIGNTGVKRVESGIYVKLECENPFGSVKDRSVTNMVLNHYKHGRLAPSTNASQPSTTVLATSGTAGLALLSLSNSLRQEADTDLGVIIVMPKAYGDRDCVGEMVELGAEVTRDQPSNARLQVCLVDGVFKDAIESANNFAETSERMLLNQQRDENNMLSHATTAEEIMRQVPSVTDVAVTTGTGGTAAGLAKFLPPHVKVHSRKAVSGTIPGLTDVTPYNNFCKPEVLCGYASEDPFERQVAQEYQERLLEKDISPTIGESAGAAYWLSREIKDEDPDATVVFISAV